ncbi:odorant receptor 43a-like [Solenopsis invicta]|uniref:odorant receptor 43a-like n=1 Tax=Solenopsis invicta TaxID=13686 RepID=UPI00193DC8E0|nr:odorant receptor 43a-like [Solenopsis invicta]XP_039307767.1 odorant receptor 43a-like [Solenopsis invicta]
MLGKMILFMLVLNMDITKSLGYRDFMWAVEFHRLAMEVIGLWPKTGKFIRKSWSEIWVGIIFILLLFISIPMICTVTRVWGDMVLLTDNLQITLPLLTILVKYVIIRCKRTVIFAIINMMAEDWMAFKHDAERNVMIRQARSARLIMIIGYHMILLGFFSVVLPPYFGTQIIYATNLTDGNRLLPLEKFHFYDTNKSPQYELTFFIHALAILLSSIIYMSVDIFLILIILHICGQLENFRCQLVSLVSCEHYKYNKVLNNIIATHLRLIRFAENIENTYSLMILIMIIYFGIVFCLNGFLFTVFITDKEIQNEVVATKFYFSSLLLIALLTNTLIYCGAGELVTEQCNAVYRAMCNLEWYKLESRKARNLILLMIRAHHPFRITAGKVIPLTMATFCNVLKTSCGYISFLLTKL